MGNYYSNLSLVQTPEFIILFLLFGTQIAKQKTQTPNPKAIIYLYVSIYAFFLDKTGRVQNNSVWWVLVHICRHFLYFWYIFFRTTFPNFSLNKYFEYCILERRRIFISSAAICVIWWFRTSVFFSVGAT